MAIGDLHVISLKPTPLGDVSLPSRLQASMVSARPILATASGDLTQVIDRSDAASSRRLETLCLSPTAAYRRVCAASYATTLGERARDCYEQELVASAGIDRRLHIDLPAQHGLRQLQSRYRCHNRRPRSSRARPDHWGRCSRWCGHRRCGRRPSANHHQGRPRPLNSQFSGELQCKC